MTLAHKPPDYINIYINTWRVTVSRMQRYIMDHIDPRSIIKGAVCSLCGERPAECLQVCRFRVGPKRREAYLDGAPDAEPFQDDAYLLVVTCGPCYDELTNERYRRYGASGGWDFREEADCPPAHEVLAVTADSGAAGKRLFDEIAKICTDDRAFDDRRLLD